MSIINARQLNWTYQCSYPSFCLYRPQKFLVAGFCLYLWLSEWFFWFLRLSINNGKLQDHNYIPTRPKLEWLVVQVKVWSFLFHDMLLSHTIPFVFDQPYIYSFIRGPNFLSIVQLMIAITLLNLWNLFFWVS